MDKGACGERSIFNHGASVNLDDATNDHELKLVQAFRKQPLSRRLAITLCYEAIQDALKQSSLRRKDAFSFSSDGEKLVDTVFCSPGRLESLRLMFENGGAAKAFSLAKDDAAIDFVEDGGI